MKKNIWPIAFAIILIGALVMMWASSRNSGLRSPSTDSNPDDVVQITVTENDHVYGPTDASVTIVEFSDFQCPACASYSPILKALVQDFPDDLRLVYKHFPLQSIHIMANKSAQAAEAAGLQGKFWEMHDKLFENQSDWQNGDEDLFFSYAEEIGLNIEQFRDDYTSAEIKDRISDSFNYALDLGLNYTPTFYVNGELISNPNSYQEFVEHIQSKLPHEDSQATTTEPTE